MKRLALLVALAAVACGKRGDPRPPVPVIPQPTSDLVVTQRADKVILTWSYPSLTTTGRSLTQVENISLYRYVEELPVSAVGRDPGSLAPGDIDPTVPQSVALFAKIPTLPQAQFEKLSTKIDSIEKANLASATAGSRLIYTDAPPFRAVDGRPVRVTYAVITEGPSARSAVSNLAIIVPLPVAVAPTNLSANAKPEGVQLTWSEPKAAVGGGAPVIDGYHIYRTSPGEALDELAAPINNAPVKATTYNDTPPYGEHEYRVTAVATTGPPLVQSGSSGPARITFRDQLAPPAPASVTALVETNVVRLLWDPVAAPDLAGYRVYRAEGTGHDPVREVGTIDLSHGIVTTTTFADPDVDLGIAYRFGVSAVDKAGNESAKTWTDWVTAPKTP
jgi:hypothetical protein